MPAFRKFLESVGEKDGKRFMKLTVVGEHIDHAVAHALFVCKVERVEGADPLLSMTPYTVVQHFNAIAYETRLEEAAQAAREFSQYYPTPPQVLDRAMAKSIATFVLNPAICRLLLPHVVKHCNVVEAIGHLEQEQTP